MELVDASRTSGILHKHGRTVKAIVCGPSDSEPNGSDSLYVFGHGFDCLGADYEWLCQTPGVVTALVVSQDITPFLPDTKDMALDQAFLTEALPRLSKNNATSPVYGRLSGKAILGGHSMGGGTSVLAADPSFAPHGNIDALVLYAPGLYTLPPAYSHRAKITAPLLVVSGAMDCGPNALPKEAMPLYQDVNSTNKALVLLKGANHCQWSNPTKGGVCAHKECHAIERPQQQAAGRALLAAFLPVVAGSNQAWAGFESALAKGKAKGTWDFITMESPPGTNLTNNCPCK